MIENRTSKTYKNHFNEYLTVKIMPNRFNFLEIIDFTPQVISLFYNLIIHNNLVDHLVTDL